MNLETRVACKKVPVKNGIRCPAGQARITGAGNLKAKYVIHAVGPRYGVDEPSDRLLVSAYQNSLDLALSYGCRSIAVPAISCGVYGYPHREAAGIAVSVCSRPEYELLAICSVKTWLLSGSRPWRNTVLPDFSARFGFAPTDQK